MVLLFVSSRSVCVCENKKFSSWLITVILIEIGYRQIDGQVHVVYCAHKPPQKHAQTTYIHNICCLFTCKPPHGRLMWPPSRQICLVVLLRKYARSAERLNEGHSRAELSNPYNYCGYPSWRQEPLILTNYFTPVYVSMVFLLLWMFEVDCRRARSMWSQRYQ